MTTAQEIRIEKVKNYLGNIIAAQVKAEAEILKVDLVLPTLSKTEKDNKRRVEMQSDKTAAQEDLKDLAIDEKIFTELLEKYSKK